VEVDNKESAGSYMKLELENLKLETLEGLFDKQPQTDDCNFINALTTWVNDQRCDLNGHAVEKKSIKKILKDNKEIKDITMDCSNAAKGKKEKEKLEKAKNVLKTILEEFGNDKAISQDGGEYKKPDGEGALCDQDRRILKLLQVQSRRMEVSEGDEQKKTPFNPKKESPDERRRMEVSEGDEQKKTPFNPKKESPDERLRRASSTTITEESKTSRNRN